MAEYIDRETVRDALYEADAITMQGVSILNQLPAADVVPMEVYKQTAWERDLAIQQLKQDYGVSIGEKKRETVRHGKWIFYGDQWAFQCTECCGWVGNDTRFKYCPNCGARMDL